jgi:hypothetical protein
MHTRNPLYVPTLRMKTGELQGLLHLAEDIKEPTIPHLIIPPLPERDDEVQAVLMDTESVPGAGLVLAKYWAGRRALLDVRYLFQDFGEAEAGKWLPKTFELARRMRIEAIPVASVTDLNGARTQPFKDTFAEGALRLALCIPAEDLVDSTAGDQIKLALERVGVAPEHTAVLVDFTQADFSQPELAADVIEGALHDLEEIARWRAIVFQGTNYPEVNPAAHGSDDLVPRNEWAAWVQAVQFGKETEDHLVFGDYAADCARMNFGKSGGRAIRHYRYTTPSHWFVVRGTEAGKDAAVMQEVSRRIIGSPHFAGRSFSSADNFIFQSAYGFGGPGNSTTWRQINTTHHITRVVRDIGAVKGRQFMDRKIASVPVQFEMFQANPDLPSP